MSEGHYQSYPEITGRLDDIVAQVKRKDASLEESLDLLDEAIELGARAVGLIGSELDATQDSPATDQTSGPAQA